MFQGIKKRMRGKAGEPCAEDSFGKKGKNQQDVASSARKFMQDGVCTYDLSRRFLQVGISTGI